MIPRSRGQVVVIGMFAAAGLAGTAACVDLFHSTDFPTLCDEDAAACAPEAGGPPDAARPDGTSNEGGSPIELCSRDSAEARRRAEHACGYLGACLGPHEDTRLGDCMTRALAAYDCSFNPLLRPRGTTAVLWDCLARASTCDAVALCVFGTPAPSCKPESGPYSACNLEPDENGRFDAGAVVVACHDSRVAVGMNPCALRGRSCATVDESKSICAGKRGAACTSSPRCEGTFAVHCRSTGGIDADEGADCASFGAGRCAQDDAGVSCVPLPDAGTCTGTAEVTCDLGATASSCVGGRAVEIHCAALGLACDAAGVLPIDPFLACKDRDAGAACTETEDDCDGDTLLGCSTRGTRYELRCSSVPGLGACTKAVGGRAACGAP